MQVKLTEVIQIWDKLVNHLADLGITSIDLSHDYYWEIMSPERYDVYEQPKELVLGQVSDDWDTLKRALEDQRLPIVYDLVKLASILRVIGEVGEAELLNQNYQHPPN